MASIKSMRFHYVNVFQGCSTVFSKQFLNVKEANEEFKKKKEEYPSGDYRVVKEFY